MFDIKRRLEKIVNKSAEDKPDLNSIPQSTKNVKKTRREMELENLYLEAFKIKEDDFSKELERHDVEIISNVNEVAKTNTESHDVKAERDSINDELKSLKDAIEPVKANLLELQSEKNSISAEISNIKSQIDARRDELLKMQSGIDTAKTEKDIINDELKILESEIKSVKTKLLKLQSEKDTILSDLANIKAQIYMKRDELLKLQSEKDNMSSNLTDMESQISVRRDELLKMQSENNAVKGERDSIIDELKLLKPELKSTMAKLLKLKSKGISVDFPFDVPFDKEEFSETYETNDYDSNVKFYELYSELTKKYPDDEEYKKRLYLLHDILKKSREQSEQDHS